MSERPVSETLESARAPRPTGPLSESAWSLSSAGLATVYRLELRQRLRSRWWAITVLVWFAVLAALTTLIFMTFNDEASSGRVGPTMFGVVALLVLSLAALVSPALSATSINGDRAHGVLAALQSTLLTPAELVIGKLLAAWTSSLILIATALPFLIWAFVLGGTSPGRLITTVVLIAISLLVVCAIGLGCSALVSRTSASGAQTYLLVTLLGLGLPLLFALTLPIVRTNDTVLRPTYTYAGDDGTGSYACRMELTTESTLHTEYSWWLLAASPYVVVADAGPKSSSSDPLTDIREVVRSARLGSGDRQSSCDPEQRAAEDLSQQRARDELPGTWPYGLAIDLAIGALFTAGAIRRLRTPAGKLPRDTRVA